MHQVPLLISEWSPIRPNFKLLKGNVNTRSSQAQPLYKIDKLVATRGPFKPELSILESCCASRYGKGQGCLLTKFWSLESRAQGGGKHINRVRFLELFEPFWFYKDNGSTLKWKSNVNTHSAQAKPLYKIKKIFVWGSFKPELSILESCCA
jgi:hypothetical protein